MTKCYHTRSAITCPKFFGPKQVELAANDVILALEGHISREEAKKVALAVLTGYGHIFRPDGPRASKAPIHRFEGGLPRIGLARPQKPSTHPFPHLKKGAR